MLSLGYDLGSSFIKGSIVDMDTGNTLAAASHPLQEMAILAPRPGWAEQDPELWWEYIVQLTSKLLKKDGISAAAIASIGISYQMHGLVCVDKEQHPLRPAIIWCDSRAVETGNKTLAALGSKYCFEHLLNAPGNFTASKLAWVKEHEPSIYARIHKIMLPGDYIGMKLTGEINTTLSGLSEGTFWDFKEHEPARALMEACGIDPALIPGQVPTFGIQGRLHKQAAETLGLKEGTPLSYRAGDQPNNALSLKVLEPGEVAATAGTSGVIYGVMDQVASDPRSRVNVFAHVNHTREVPRLGVLLCINGTGILNAWMRKQLAREFTYDEMNTRAASVDSSGLCFYPFGNGAERMLGNQRTGGCLQGLDFNRHTLDHVLRAGQEGIAFSFRYGLEIMRTMGLQPRTIRAGQANLFLSPLFRQTLSTLTGATIQLHDTDGATGAARAAGFGAGQTPSLQEAFRSLKILQEVQPDSRAAASTLEAYEIWRRGLETMLVTK
jgi:xylulokinase